MTRMEHKHIIFLLVLTFFGLSILQIYFTNQTMMTIGICALAGAFGFKLWLFVSSVIVMYHQKGNSQLAKAGLAFFCALASMAFALLILFGFAALDLLAIYFHEYVPQVELVAIRNVIRNFAITTVVAVVIYGSRMMDVVFADFYQQRRGTI